MSTTRSDDQQADAAAALRNATFARSEGSAPAPDAAVTASDLLLGAYDPTKLHPMAGIEDKLDYLLLEDDKTSDLPGSGTAIPSRGWSDDLSYGTGTMYLSGSYLVSYPVSPPQADPLRSKSSPLPSCLPHVISGDHLLLSCTITCRLHAARPCPWRSMGPA